MINNVFHNKSKRAPSKEHVMIKAFAIMMIATLKITITALMP